MSLQPLPTRFHLFLFMFVLGLTPVDVTAQPASPSGVTVSQNFADRIEVRWNGVSGAARYRVYRIDDAAPGALPCGTGGVLAHTTAQNSGVTLFTQPPSANSSGVPNPGIDSYFRIRSIGPNGELGGCSGWGLGRFAPPIITTHPQASRIWLGETVVLEGAGFGPHLLFLWQRSALPSSTSSFRDITGAPFTPSYTFVPTLTDNNFFYRVGVRNGAGTTWSIPTQLKVDGPPELIFNPSPSSVFSGQTATFSVVASGAGLSYLWQYFSEALQKWVAISSATESTYSFTASSTLNGRLYRAQISNGAGAVLSTPASLTVHGAPVITSHPLSITASVGANVSFNCAANGVGVQYQWYRNSAAIAGETLNSLALPGVDLADSGARLQCRATNPAGTANSNIAVLTVVGPPTATPTRTPTSSPTSTPTHVTTPSATPTTRSSPTPQATGTSTWTPSPTASSTYTPTAAATFSATPSVTTPTPATPSATPSKDPIALLDCVDERVDGLYIAQFGYSLDSAPLTIPEGVDNSISGEIVSGQVITDFEVGVFKRAFEVLFRGNAIAWNLRDQSVVASDQSPRCCEGLVDECGVCRGGNSCLSVCDTSPDLCQGCTDSSSEEVRKRLVKLTARMGKILSRAAPKLYTLSRSRKLQERSRQLQQDLTKHLDLYPTVVFDCVSHPSCGTTEQPVLTEGVNQVASDIVKIGRRIVIGLRNAGLNELAKRVRSASNRLQNASRRLPKYAVVCSVHN